MKYLKYAWYVLRHKYYVFIECQRVGHLWRGIVHDMSKFRPSEFFPYAEYFYGDSSKYDAYEKNRVLENFNRAWLKHIHRNPHHWQHWVLHFDDGGYELIDVPHEFRWEMLCDWIGAGKSIKGGLGVGIWYAKNHKNQMINQATKKWIIGRIGVYNKYGKLI